MQRILQPGDIEALDHTRFPRVLPPAASSLFAERAARLRQLADGNPIADYLLFVAKIVDAQHQAVAHVPVPTLADDIKARAQQHGMPLMPALDHLDPAWHDVQVGISGPAVHDVETTFRERWEDTAPLTSNPGRRLASWLQAEDQTPKPLGEQWPPPPPVEGGHDAVQLARTYPKILPKPYDFAPDGERTIALGNAKAMSRARRLVYVEDQYLWGPQVGEHFASVLRERPDLRLVITCNSWTARQMVMDWHLPRTSVRIMPCVVSRCSATASCATGASKLGQPQPALN